MDPVEAPAAAARTGAEPTWHSMTVQAALAAQGVALDTGLSRAEVDARVSRYGPNRFAEAPPEPRWRAFLRQYRDPMQIVLLVAGVICLFLPGQLLTGVLLIILTLINAVLGLNQEGKAEASVAELQKMMVVRTRVRRGGELTEIPMEGLVPGDVVLIEAGDLVPADGRIVRAATLEIDESALTGESAPVPKQVDPVAEDAPLGDRLDMAFMNTQVTRGSGTLVVTASGMATEVGNISGMLQRTRIEKTPLTRQLDRLTSQILVIAGGALLLSIAIGLSRGESLNTLFLTAVAFAVSAIPTGLPAVVTAILAGGTSALAAAGAIVKRLRSVETLGSTSAINSDKTGTLTLNQMTAVQMSIAGRRYRVTGEGYSVEGRIQRTAGQGEVALEPYLLPMALCADAEIRDGGLVGDPTEGALVVLAAKGGIDPQLTRERYPRVAELPFDAAYKMMATFHEMTDARGDPVVRCYVKGAPDQLLARAGSAYSADGISIPIDQVRDLYLAENERLGAQGLRVMATAQRDFDPAGFDAQADLLPELNDLALMSLVGIVDPPRPEARASIATASSAGIRVRMITGDHAITAQAIAGQLGIDGRAITGAEFAAMSDEAALAEIDGIGVIARVTPEHKVRLVDVLRRRGDTVAMTGDGVNDAPALKKADIGVAMGITGSEVAKEAAVMILTDDNFATIVKAVEQGRALYDNLMRYIRFQMGCLFGFIGAFLGASIFGIAGGIPFLPLQTLWVNFTVDVFQAVGLGWGTPRTGLMDQPPRAKEQAILGRRLLAWLLAAGLLMTAGTLAVIAWATGRYGDAIAHTMGLTTFSVFNLFFSLETADEDISLFSGDVFRNGRLVRSTVMSVLAIFMATELRPFQRLLGTQSLTGNQWALCVAVGLSIVLVAEVKKLLRIRTLPRAALAEPAREGAS